VHGSGENLIVQVEVPRHALRRATLAAVFGVMALSGRGAAAVYCAYAGGVGGFENCGYHTFEQCLAGAAGRGRAYMRNPHDPALWVSQPHPRGLPAATAPECGPPLQAHDPEKWVPVFRKR